DGRCVLSPPVARFPTRSRIPGPAALVSRITARSAGELILPGSRGIHSLALRAVIRRAASSAPVGQLAERLLGLAEQGLDLTAVGGGGEAVAGGDDAQHLVDPVDEVRGVLPAGDRLAGDRDVDGARVRPGA